MAPQSKFQDVWQGKTLTIIQPKPPQPRPDAALPKLLAEYYQSQIAPLIMARTSRRKIGIAKLLWQNYYMHLLVQAKTKKQRQLLQDVHEEKFWEIEKVMQRDLPPALIDEDEDAEHDIAMPLGILTDR